ncbi:MAG: helix-turn-helix domain-containing protein [Candidatus Uhrbacteria bacterium]|nr:hypothetical protein [Patescibacteria group bacterium]MBU1907152.1 hypothetical protein [Patescibacteria group bacterium]
MSASIYCRILGGAIPESLCEEERGQKECKFCERYIEGREADCDTVQHPGLGTDEVSDLIDRVYAFANGEDVREPQEEVVLEDIHGSPKTRLDTTVEFKRFVIGIAQRYNLNPQRLFSTTRLQAVVLPRFILMYLMHEAGYTLTGIAVCFGKDHTTVLHGCGKIKERIAANPGFANEVELARRAVDAVTSEMVTLFNSATEEAAADHADDPPAQEKIQAEAQVESSPQESQVIEPPTKLDISISFEDYLRAVALRYSIKQDSILGDSRERRHTLPRQVLMYLMKEAGFSMQEIATNLGKHYQTGVVSCRKIGQMIVSDGEFALEVELARMQVKMLVGVGSVRSEHDPARPAFRGKAWPSMPQHPVYLSWWRRVGIYDPKDIARTQKPLHHKNEPPSTKLNILPSISRDEWVELLIEWCSDEVLIGGARARMVMQYRDVYDLCDATIDRYDMDGRIVLLGPKHGSSGQKSKHCLVFDKEWEVDHFWSCYEDPKDVEGLL